MRAMFVFVAPSQVRFGHSDHFPVFKEQMEVLGFVRVGYIQVGFVLSLWMNWSTTLLSSGIGVSMWVH